MKSKFQFNTPTLLGFQYFINKEFENNGEQSVAIELKTKIQVNRNPDDREAFVVLTVDIGEQSVKAPFYIMAEEGATFRWDTDLSDEKQIQNLLNQNAPALLLSYLRPIVAGVTSASYFGTYHIPFINFVVNK